MKIAILGGGITGLTASYYAQKKGHEVTLFEKEQNLGGLAAGFNPPNSGWEWPLERAYHHIFATDSDIINFANEIDYKGIFFNTPITASLYEITNNQLPITNKFSIYPFDSPIDLLRFPLLTFSQKIRTGLTLGFLKLSPYLNLYEREYAEDFLKKTMGTEVWNVLWEELFRKKFGKYAGNIVSSFIWARIKKRTKQLGYMEGGFQTFIDYLESTNKKAGVVIKKGEGVGDIKKSPLRQSSAVAGFIVNDQEYDVVISTLPTTLMTKITKQLVSDAYLNNFEKLHYLHAVNLIIESKMPLFENEYWMNVCTDELPFTVLVQHTNFIDKKHYGGNHLLYIGNYVDRDDKLLKMENEEILNYFLPYLQQINSTFKHLPSKTYVFKAPWAQPIFDKDFIGNKPEFETPIKNFFIANLDMTYPYDRGTNYAVKLGKEVAAFV